MKRVDHGKDAYYNAVDMEGGAFPFFLLPLLAQIATPLITKLVKGGCSPHDLKKMEGSGVFQDIGKKIAEMFAKEKPALKRLAKEVASRGIDEGKRRIKGVNPVVEQLLGNVIDDLGENVKSRINQRIGSGVRSGGRAVRSAGGVKSGSADKRKARGALIKQLMKKHCLTLAEASAYIKKHNLKY